MNITRTLLLILVVAISLAGLTSSVRAAAATTQPAGAAADPTPRTGDAPPKLDEDGKSDDETAPAGSEIKRSDAPPSTQPGPKKPQPKFYENPMFLLLGAMLLMFLFMGRGKRKTERQRKEMLAALKKGDKVTTIGGIVGTVMEVRDDEVTVKIDESSNTRMRFARWAVRGVGNDAKTETPEDKK